MITRKDAEALDAKDPLAGFRDRFALPPGVIYLDGNSLGVLPKGVAERVSGTIADEWGRDLIASWNKAGWIALPLSVGDMIAPLIGADAGDVVVGDSTSVNLFKCLSAALMAQSVRTGPGRKVIVTEAENFPTDNYIIQGAAKLLDAEIRYTAPGQSPIPLIDGQTAVVLLTHVNYRTAAMYDMAAITKAAHDNGALMIWDLSHSTGAVPLDLKACNVDFAVGCSYKYLNGGPGAPAFTYALKRIAQSLTQPLSGWMGHKNPFAFSLDYEPGEAIKRFLCGTPQVLSLAALQAALTLWRDVDLAALRAKSLSLTSLFMDLVAQECGDFGLEAVTPRDPARRGSHVSLRFEHGYPVMRAMADHGVVGDFRAPDLMRFGFTPLYISHAETYEAVQRLKTVLESNAWREEKYQTRLAVT